MSVEFWRNAELFYELWASVIGVLLLSSLIVIIFIVSYAKKENKRKFILVVLGLMVVLGITGIVGHTRYRPYLNQASYSNPLIRDRAPRLGTYTYYGTNEQNYYSQMNAIESLRNMVLYEEERITELVNYLGEGGYFHYFEQSDGEIFKKHRHVKFTETASHAQLVGSRFNLKDESFQEIGFINPANTMFEYIEIPVSEEGKTYEPEDDFQIPQAEEVYRQWNF